eukprot:scaffold873_cov393-Prasinococcus_capsulatus_cf.AAC.21
MSEQRTTSQIISGHAAPRTASTGLCRPDRATHRNLATARADVPWRSSPGSPRVGRRVRYFLPIKGPLQLTARGHKARNMVGARSLTGRMMVGSSQELRTWNCWGRCGCVSKIGRSNSRSTSTRKSRELWYATKSFHVGLTSEALRLACTSKQDGGVARFLPSAWRLALQAPVCCTWRECI